MKERTGLKIACPEEIAYRMNFISPAELERLIAPLKDCSYRDYLVSVVEVETRVKAGSS